MKCEDSPNIDLGPLEMSCVTLMSNYAKGN
jgi:hypothetical protein